MKQISDSEFEGPIDICTLIGVKFPFDSTEFEVEANISTSDCDILETFADFFRSGRLFDHSGAAS